MPYVPVDIVCYRKYGHNEIDEPMFTQPLMYKVIKQHPSAHQVYATKLVEEGSMNPEEIKTIQDNVTTTLEREFNDSKAGPHNRSLSVQLQHL